MSKVQIVLNSSGIQEMLKCGAICSELQQQADNMIKRNGGNHDYYTVMKTGRTRSYATVRSDEWAAYGHWKKVGTWK